MTRKQVRASPSRCRIPCALPRGGIAEAIRTDNGALFAPTGIHDLSALNVWWMPLGIVHQHITPSLYAV